MTETSRRCSCSAKLTHSLLFDCRHTEAFFMCPSSPLFPFAFPTPTVVFGKCQKSETLPMARDNPSVLLELLQVLNNLVGSQTSSEVVNCEMPRNLRGMTTNYGRREKYLFERQRKACIAGSSSLDILPTSSGKWDSTVYYPERV